MSSVAPAPLLAVGHVGINVTDLDRSVAFYTAALGMRVASLGDDKGRRFAFLARDAKMMLTLWEQADGQFDSERAGLHHLSFEVEDIDAVRTAELAVAAAGGRFVHDGVVAHREGASSGGIFFLDPDGTRLEIYTPVGATEAPAPSGDAPTCGFF